MLYGTHNYEVIALVLALAMFAAFYWIARFIAASHRAHEGEAHFRVLAEAIPQIVWTAVRGGGVDYCNHRWYELTGMTQEQTLGWGWRDGLHPDDLPVALKNWEKCHRSGQPFEMDYRLRTAAGDFRWHLVRSTPMRDSSGTIIKWFGACADIEDQMHTQQLLEAQVKHHTAALMDANTRLQSEMRERALVQQELNQQSERMVRELTQRSNRATNLAKMAEMLQSCSDLTDAFSVVVAMAPKIFSELRGAVLLFNSSRDKLDVAAVWTDCALPAGGFGPQDCWALRTGHAHVVMAGDGTPSAATRPPRTILVIAVCLCRRTASRLVSSTSK